MPGALSPIERACLYLWSVREESVDGIARVFGWTEEQVRATLATAEQKLQALAAG